MESKPSINNLEVGKSRDLYQPQERIERFLPSSETSIERQGDTHRDVIKATPPSQILSPPLLPAPVQDDISVQVIDDSPLTASDDDLIEKEWVDKAKQIVASTKDDPHLREQEVAKLQADYLRKRYGKELG